MYRILFCWTGLISVASYGLISHTVASNGTNCADRVPNGSRNFEMVKILNTSLHGTDVCPLRNDKVLIIEVVPLDKTKFTFRDLYICLPKNIKQGTLVFNGVILESKPKMSVYSLCEPRDTLTFYQNSHRTTTFLLLRMHPVSKLKVLYSPDVQHKRRKLSPPTKNINTANHNWSARPKRNLLSQKNYTTKYNVIDYTECGKTRGCFRDGDRRCQHFECNYFISYRTDNIDADIELSGKSNGWVAIGFSSDKKMGGDEILACIYQDRDIKVVSYKDPHPRVRPEAKQSFAVLKHAESKNGYMYCRFDVPVKRDDSGVDLTNEWTQLYARGGIRGGLMEKHTTTPLISERQISIVEHVNVFSTATILLPSHLLYIALIVIL